MPEITFTTREIPVKPFIKSYLEHNTMRKHLVKIVYELLCKRSVDVAAIRLNQEEYSERVRLKIPEEIFYKKGYTLDKRGIVLFNQAVEGEIKGKFEQELLANLRAAKRFNTGFEIQEVICDLRDELNLSESDLSFERLKKMLYRFSKSQNIDLEFIKKLGKNVPQKHKITVNLRHIKRSEAVRKIGVTDKTFYRWEQAGLISRTKHGGTVYVDLLSSQLPPTYQISV